METVSDADDEMSRDGSLSEEASDIDDEDLDKRACPLADATELDDLDRKPRILAASTSASSDDTTVRARYPVGTKFLKVRSLVSFVYIGSTQAFLLT